MDQSRDLGKNFKKPHIAKKPPLWKLFVSPLIESSNFLKKDIKQIYELWKAHIKVVMNDAYLF